MHMHARFVRLASGTHKFACTQCGALVICATMCTCMHVLGVCDLSCVAVYAQPCSTCICTWVSMHLLAIQSNCCSLCSCLYCVCLPLLQVLLYGAIVQTATPGNPAGLEHGWAWLARCLNAVPPTR
jgi:hypothetical protein